MVAHPSLSVILPVYNAGPFLKNAVQSVLDQTYTDFEIIAINDGSTDESLQTLQSFHDPRLRVFDQENRGLNNTLHRGIELASAALVARMDQDDQCLPHRFAVQVAFMQSHPEVGVCGGAVILDDNGKRGVVRFPATDVGIKWRLCFTSALVHPTVMFRKAIVESVGSYRQSPDINLTEDYDLWTRLAPTTTFANITDPILILRKHGGNMTSASNLRHLQQSQEVSHRYVQAILKHPVSTAVMARLRREATEPEDALPASNVLEELQASFLKYPDTRQAEQRNIQRDVASRHMWLRAYVASPEAKARLLTRAWHASPTRALYYFIRYQIAKVAAIFRSRNIPVKSSKKVMKILIIAMSDSIHTARWLSQISNRGWDIHLFPSIDLGEVHPAIRNVTVHHTFFAKVNTADASVRLRGTNVFSKNIALVLRSLFRLLSPHKRAEQLSRLLYEIQPDVIHTLETQHSGYLLIDALTFGAPTPKPWVHSLWGSDLFYFGRFPKHRARIQQVLDRCTHLICEGNRDVQLARSLGFTGIILPNMQATGGFDLQKCERLSSNLQPSKRHLIVLKGYESWSGRALTALRALHLCKDVLTGYTLALIHARPNSPVAIAAKQLAHEANLHLRLVPIGLPHDAILKLYGQARLSISIAISDGVPNSLLESMAMGTFPIQSNTSCADEWVKDGETSFLVPPDDLDKISMAIRRSLQDSTLVDNAAKQNASVIYARQNILVNQKRTVEMYESLIGKRVYAKR